MTEAKETIDLEKVVEIAIVAGTAILEVYANAFKVEIKADGSPLTEADRRADQIIREGLQKLNPDIPLLSEESETQAFAERRDWHRFWLVDPLDGTKEFVKRSGDFTVNIALIEGDHAVLGVVYTPLKRVVHYATRNAGAFKRELPPDTDGNDSGGKPQPIRVKKFNREKVVLVTSRSHASKAVEVYRSRLAAEVEEVEIAKMGSSMKICLIAEGLADIYPRLGPTSEWDTAAAHCVLESAGGSLTSVTGEPLRYNKENILNPWFLASGDPEFNWHDFAPDGV